MEKFLEVVRLITTPESAMAGMSFKPRQDDVFIATYPKCGTTFVTQIAHVLRSNGDTDFGEITERVPWDMVAKAVGQVLDADQPFYPRLFKSHFPYTDIAKGARYIHVVRNPENVILSMYPFLLGMAQMNESEVSFETFFYDIFLTDRNMFGIVCDFYKTYLEAKADILWVFYENLLEDSDREIQRIAKFMELDKTVSPEDYESRCLLAKKMSGKEYMATHDTQFDDHFIYQKRKADFPGDYSQYSKPGVSKVNTTVKKVLTKDMKERLDKLWQDTMYKDFGFASYNDLRKNFAS